MKVKLNILHRTVISIDIQNHFKIMSMYTCCGIQIFDLRWKIQFPFFKMRKFEPMFSISFCFQLLQKITWPSWYPPLLHITGMAVLIWYISTVQGWVCAAIGCVQCTAVFLSSSSICLIAVDRWESCELGLHWWLGAWFGAIMNFQQLQELRQTFRSF